MSEAHHSSTGGAARNGSWLDPIRAVQDKPWWPWTKRALVLVFFVVVASLLFHQAAKIDWSKVAESMGQQTAGTLAIAGLLGLSSHAVYSSFDLFGRRVTGHRLPTLKVMVTTFVSYVFNLNVGILIGGLGFRYRLYARQGLPAEMTTTVIAISMLTNWLGFLLLGGFLLMVRPPELPGDWVISANILRIAGVVMVCLAGAWQLACAFSTRREWQFGESTITLPNGRMSALQLFASAINWSLMGAIVYVLLGREIAYLSVLTTLLVGAVAGLIIRVPAGLGVFEAVFVGLLGSQASSSDLIGALLLYRAFYYLAPLAPALVLQWWIESNASESDAGEAAQARLQPATGNAAA